MISLSCITLVHMGGINTEVLNHYSTQFSEAKTAYASKQFLELLSTSRTSQRPPCAVCILLTQTEQGDTHNHGCGCIISGVIHFAH